MSSNAQRLRHPRFNFDHGLHNIGNGIYAWLQPGGGWGLSNSGLVCDSGQSLVVDTLFDVPLTEEMLRCYRDAERGAATEIDVVVNTHHNGDHCNGNCCCGKAEIIAHEATAADIPHEDPKQLAVTMTLTNKLGDLGVYLDHAFGGFDFASVTQKLPTRTFRESLQIQVGNKAVELTHVGPAHSSGDTLAYVPADKTVFTGDILFVESHPIIWAGPVQNWLDACDHILALDVDAIVPGHGPITTKNGVAAIRNYLTHVRDEASKCFSAGLSYEDAAREIGLGGYRAWADRERIVLNVAALYREFGATDVPSDPAVLFGVTAQLFKELSAPSR